MTEQAILELFSHVCGQSPARSFSVDGHLLPVDQRCLGLYLGAVITGLWLTVSGVWRMGLPGRGLVALHFGLLVLIVLGGWHIIDPGPTWRLALGLFTGHITMIWLIGGARDIWTATLTDSASGGWTARATSQGFVWPLLLVGLALIFPALLPFGWAFWTGATLFGLLILAASLLTAAVVLVLAQTGRFSSS